MKRAHVILVLGLLLAGCDDSDGGVDAPPGSGDASQDVDALVSTPDGGGMGLDAGPGVTIAQACERVCARVPVCFNEPPDPTCMGDCAADLADCTQGEIEAVYDCGGVACNELKMCVGSIGCITG